MKITVTKDNVKIEKFDIVHEGEHRVNKCSFSFSEEYTEDLVKKAIFTLQNDSIEIPIINNECDIPGEILKARNIVLLGVYAYKVTEDKLDLRYSPSPDAFKVNSGSYIEGASKSEEIMPSQFEKYMQALNDGLNKVEESLVEMDSATSSVNDLVDEINQKLENGDFIGPEGPQGVPGNDGTDGVGITTITSGQSSVEEDKTVTPVTVNKTDGTQQTFEVSAENGIDGTNGTDGTDGVTPNLQIGTVTTLEPNEQATVTRTGTDEQPIFNFGIPQGIQGEQGIQGIPGQDGHPGQNGTDGKDATVNGQNTVEITTDNNITLDQQESVLKLGLNSQLIPKNDIEGTDNVFNDGLESPLYTLGGDGKSEQVTTTGKNLLPNNVTGYTSNGITIAKNEEGALILNGTTITGMTINIATNITLPAGTYTNSIDHMRKGIYLSFDNIGDTMLNGVQLNSSKTFTISESTKYNKYFIYIDSGTTFNNEIFKIQVEEGLAATSYEPYTGGQPSPSPDYEQPINSIEGGLEFACRGKNLFDKNSADDLLIYPHTDRLNSTTDNYSAIFKCQPNTIYSISKTSLSKTSLIICGTKDYPKIGDFPLNRMVYNNSNIANGYKTTTDTNYLIIRYSNPEDTLSHSDIFNTIMIEQGSQATDYEPYIQPNEVTFNLNDEKLRSVGDVKDELVVDLDTGDYYKNENIGEIVFDGSEDEGWYKTINTKVNRFGIVLNRISGAGVMSNKWIMSNIDVINPNYILDYVNNTSIYVNFSDISENDDLATFKSWLSVNKPIVDYLLQNPTTKKLGTLSAEDLAKLKTFYGYNNVTINTNLGLMNIRFTYGLDIKKYVDNKIAQLSEQLIKGE